MLAGGAYEAVSGVSRGSCHSCIGAGPALRVTATTATLRAQVKTRRRKGMSDDVSISRFFDLSMLGILAQQDL